MNQTNKVYLIGLACIVGGFLIGWSLRPQSNSAMKHMMPDGSMMHNHDMDMATMMADMNAALMGKTGDAFDQAFITEMIVHHEGAVDMARLALTNAKHQEIKDLATAIIKAQTSEIDQMKEWQKKWYGEK